MTNPEQLLRIAAVSERTSLAKSTINLWVVQGKFPRPIALSPTIKVWRSQQITDWVNSLCISADQNPDGSVEVAP